MYLSDISHPFELPLTETTLKGRERKDYQWYMLEDNFFLLAEPETTHVGLQNLILSSNNFQEYRGYDILEVTYEAVRNKILSRGFDMLLSHRGFRVGSIQLPEHLSNVPFTVYGTSIPDMAITSKTSYYVDGHALAAVVGNETEDDDDIGYYMNDGAIEFENKYFAFEQTAKEMWRVAGDITVKGVL